MSVRGQQRLRGRQKRKEEEPYHEKEDQEFKEQRIRQDLCRVYGTERAEGRRVRGYRHQDPDGRGHRSAGAGRSVCAVR